MGDVDLREYVEALFERDRAARETADAEREKSAQALALSLCRQIEQGDEALREHIHQQVEQIRSALAAVHREMELITEASQKAIEKAEAATEKRFESMNEWRGQSADRERSQEEQMAKLSGTFLPREVADAQFQELRKQVQVAQEIISARAAARASEKETRQGLSSTAGLAIAGVGLLLTALTIVITVMLAVNDVF